MKSGTIIRIVVWGSVAIAAAIVLYVYFSRQRVNQCIQEANHLIDEGDDARKAITGDEYRIIDGTGLEKYQVKHAPAGPMTAAGKGRGGSRAFDLDQAKLAQPVAAVDEKIKKVIECYRNAAAKFEEGRKYTSNKVVDKYLDLMSQAYQKRAEDDDCRRQAMLLLVDKSLSEAERASKHKSLSSDAQKAGSQFDQLDEGAKKLRKENKSLFKDDEPQPK
jgi:hypothetical protein